jgi:sec-independent protein translocase protein TatB
MFDIGWSEMAIIMLVALIVIGPKDLPRVARNVGRWVAKGRKLAREFQSQLEDMARDAELDQVKNEIEKAGRTDLKRSVERSIDPKGELKDAFDPAVKPAGQKKKQATPAEPAVPAPPAAPAPPPETGDRPNGPEPAKRQPIAAEASPAQPAREQAPTS